MSYVHEPSAPAGSNRVAAVSSAPEVDLRCQITVGDDHDRVYAGVDGHEDATARAARASGR